MHKFECGNLNSYDGVENLDRFTDKEFDEYCDEKLQGCLKHIAFIRNNISKEKLSVCEIGSGNSKLLYQLEKHNMLKSALGVYELSKR